MDAATKEALDKLEAAFTLARDKRDDVLTLAWDKREAALTLAWDKREAALLKRSRRLTRRFTLAWDKREAALTLAWDKREAALTLAWDKREAALTLDWDKREAAQNKVIKDHRTEFYRTEDAMKATIAALHAVAKGAVLNASEKEAVRFAIAKKGELYYGELNNFPAPVLCFPHAMMSAIAAFDAPAKGGALGGVDAPECPVIPRDDPVCIKRLKGLYSLIRRA